MAYVRKPYEELSIIDNYLFNELTNDPEIGEDFCRLLVSGLLGRKVGNIRVTTESIKTPSAPETRGIRLDVEIDVLNNDSTVSTIYDIEPHTDKESNYPKKNRFTQAMIDKNHMKSGDNDFNHLPELYIICITNYDPFGYDQMVYTFKKQCVEVPEIWYDDEVTVIYFYTKGKLGGSESLGNFLRYIEKSEQTNAVDSNTEQADKYVKQVKHDVRKRGIYVTVGEWVDGIVREAVEDAVAEKDAAIANKDAELADKDAAIADKDAELANKDAELADKDAELADKDAELADKDAQLADKDAEIAKKEDEISKLKAEIDQLKNK